MQKRFASALAISLVTVAALQSRADWTATADGSGYVSLDAGTTQHPLQVTHTTAVDGSEFAAGSGSFYESTLTVPEQIGALAGANGYAYSAPGVLHVQVHGLAFINGLPEFDPMVETSFGSSFTDTLHLTTSTLAPGTPVSYHGSLEIDVGQYGAYYYSGNGYSTGTFVLQYSVNGAGSFYDFPTPGFSDLPDLHFEIPFDGSGSVGDAVPISCSLSLGVQDRANNGYGNEQETVLSGPDGVHFFVDAVTTGLTITSDSGHDYALAAPEPTFASAGAVAVLALLARRRRRRAR
jgi:hypothetical protein